MNRAHRIADQVRSVVGFLNRVPTESQFLSKGLLTPAEFVEAGEQLVFQCPSWQWQGCHTRKRQVFWLPPSKQYLLTRNIPCRHRVKDWDNSFCRKAHITSEGWLVPGHFDETSNASQNSNASVVVRKSVECKVRTADGDEWAVRHGGESSENEDEGSSSSPPSLRTSTSSSAPSCSSGLGELATMCSNNGQDKTVSDGTTNVNIALNTLNTAPILDLSRPDETVVVAVVRRQGCCNQERTEINNEIRENNIALSSSSKRAHRSNNMTQRNSVANNNLNLNNQNKNELLSYDFVEIDDIENGQGKEVDEDGDFTVIGDGDPTTKVEGGDNNKIYNEDGTTDNLSSVEDDGKNMSLVPTRSYDLSITYDKYYQSPRLWLFGYDESGVPLRADAVFEDIHSDYLSKTVTVDPHPFTGVPTVSVHPCKHASVMRNVAQSWLRSGITPRHDLALFVLLKMVSSVVPTINFDFTIDIEMPIGISFEEKPSDDNEEITTDNKKSV